MAIQYNEPPRTDLFEILSGIEQRRDGNATTKLSALAEAEFNLHPDILELDREVTKASRLFGADPRLSDPLSRTATALYA